MLVPGKQYNFNDGIKWRRSIDQEATNERIINIKLKNSDMKKITTIIIFLVGIILGIFIKSEYDSVKSKKVVVKQDYIFKGNVKVDEDTIDLRKPVDDSIHFNYGIAPFKVCSHQNGIIPNAKTAVDFAKIILNYHYGEEEINEEKPFDVELVNNRVWYIYGSLPAGAVGGVVEISIQKSDGKVLAIFHGK